MNKLKLVLLFPVGIVMVLFAIVGLAIVAIGTGFIKTAEYLYEKILE